MCTCNAASAAQKPDRRILTKWLMGATGAGLLPIRARAATVTALAVTCIDYRMVDDAVTFFDGKHLHRDYDQVSLAGAALAAVSDKFPSSNAAFWDHIAIAQQLHHISRVIVVDHRDCGAYKVAFGKDYQGEGAAETEQHKGVMQQVKARMARTHPDLSSEFYLMALNGTAERLV